MDTYNELLELIIKKKKESKLETNKFANIVGVDRQSMRNYLKRYCNMPAVIMFECLRVFGISLRITEQDQTEKEKEIVV